MKLRELGPLSWVLGFKSTIYITKIVISRGQERRLCVAQFHVLKLVNLEWGDVFHYRPYVGDSTVLTSGPSGGAPDYFGCLHHIGGPIYTGSKKGKRGERKRFAISLLRFTRLMHCQWLDGLGVTPT